MPPPNTVGLPQRFFIIGEQNGTFERVEVVRSPLADVDSQLRNLAQELAMFIPRLFILPESRLACSASLTSKLLTLVCRLPSLRMSTYWRVVPASRETANKPTIVPHFVPADGAIRLAPEWLPPADMALFFLSHFDAHPTGWLYNRSSLAAIHTNKAVHGFFKLPLPNIYPNCKLCLGNDGNHIQPDVRAPLSVVMEKSLNVFQNSGWNADLLASNPVDIIHQFFRFSAEDNKTPMPARTDWPAHFIKVSNSDFNNIPFISIV